MTSLPAFPEFFQALWDYEPFPWQVMLAERVADGQWPQAIDLPTAAGKTACIDAAIYALAAQADKPLAERTAPRRIWFVIDRRIVVDEAFDRAETIAKKLQKAQDGPLKAIADRLRQLSGTERPLAAARLRGGVLRDDNWGRLPSQPAVITSTVDQLGSRLLFRGYGHSNLTASIYAGLAAHDSLILLDEAHCSVPFMQTLRAIETLRGEAWAETPIVTPFAFSILSATPPADIPHEDVFPGDDRARALDHPILRRRLSASKPAALVAVKDRKPDGDPLVAQAVDQALSYQKEDKRRVAVIVNRVHTARTIASALRTKAGESADVVLLTGRIRPYERDRLIGTWRPFLKANAPDEPAKPIILVSTQCIEVGADFSFDALVTEAASLDALRQRFGRLNRMGEPGSAPAVILIRNRDAKEGQADPIYGSAISTCWALLNEKAATEGEAKIIDFGFDELGRKLSDVDDLGPCLAPRPDAPILLPAYLDLLCQTAPAPAVEPDIGLFLHGKERGTPEARVVWRADLSPNESGLWKETVALCPPANGEMLAVPLHRLRAWLAKDATGDEDASDVEGAAPAEDESAPKGKSHPFLRWRGRDRSDVCDQPQEIKPNDVIVVPAAYGTGGLGQSEPHEVLGTDGLDLWELARKASGKATAMRVGAATLGPWRTFPPVADLIAIAEDSGRERESVREALDAVIAYEPTVDDEPQNPFPTWLRNLIGETRDGRIEEHPAGGIVLFTKHDRRDAEPDLFADDDDLMSAIVAGEGEAASLARHTKSVECAVSEIASRCLPAEFRDPLVRSACWHDVGKLDERFQHLLRQDADVSGEPLAKSVSMPASPGQRKALRAAAGLPKGFRHEMLSLQIAERCAVLDQDEEDLILHLVASHHGYARPFAPVVCDREPPDISGRHAGVSIVLAGEERARSIHSHDLASGVADRFWRLTRRYGWWGLAYIEAVLRLGDWYGSVVIVDSELARDPSPPILRACADIANAKQAAGPIVLTAIDGANPLGFLAALGMLAVLQKGAPQARLGWRREATWRPILTCVDFDYEDALCERIAAALRGHRVADDADAKREGAERTFSAAKKAVADKLKEIKKRGLRGAERKAAIETEVAPLEQNMQQRRSEWLDALKDAVPSRELALGQRIDCTDEEYRDHSVGFLDDARIDAREPLDLLAAFASDACVDKSDRVAATPFCFITGSGHQYFLDTVRQLIGVVSAKRVRAALFEPWTYSDEKLSMRWDPVEDRRYALMDRDPTASDNKSRTVWMANLLAYRALALFPSAPGRRGLETTGWSAPGAFFSWPIWEYPAALDTIRSLMQLPDLGAEHPDRCALRARGVAGVFRAQRIKVGSGANYKINFSPARSA